MITSRLYNMHYTVNAYTEHVVDYCSEYLQEKRVGTERWDIQTLPLPNDNTLKVMTNK